jgi:multifunctional beta-oxidation protein
MTSSAAGLFGSSGQCNYSAAKLGVYGLAETLGKEGVKYNILVNAIMPVTASQLAAMTMTTEMRQHLDPKHIAPLVAYLGHPANKENGSIFEVGAGHVSKYRWERSQGAVLKCMVSYLQGRLQRFVLWSVILTDDSPWQATRPSPQARYSNAGLTSTTFPNLTILSILPTW